ncbi:MAG: hypothetical protein JXR64_08785 [Spirochaetales bacterium]|nr:hypothetical protein [Spirochaetales bacterium]
MLKKYFILLFILISISTIASYQVDILTGTNWTISEKGEPKKNISVESSLNFQSENNEIIVLETTFKNPDTNITNAGLIFYKNNMAMKVYVNGFLIDTFGDMPKSFFFEPYITRGIIINQAILKPVNTIKIEVWNDSGIYKLRKLDVLDLSTYKEKMKTYNFLDIQLPRLASILLFFVALYSIFLFITYPERKLSLYLGLASLLFGIYLLNVTISNSVLPYIILKAILYGCFPLSMMFLFYYFNSFFNIGLNNKKLLIITALGIILAIGYFFQNNSAKLDSWHSLMLIYPVTVIVFGTIGAIKNLLQKKKGSIPILIGLFMAVFFSGYDIYYFIGDITPIILLQGLGFMTMIFGSFYSFSVEIADTNKQCSILATNLQKNNEHKELLFTNIQKNTVQSESSSSLLNESIDRVGSLVSQYFVSVDNINKNLLNQNEHVIKNRENVDYIFDAIQNTSKMVDKHGNLVEITVEDLKELSKEIHQVDNLVKKSGNTIEKLTNVCVSADKDVATSIIYINDLVDYSKKINDIVKSITEISEQTNILSINAAIEAARSGHMGKGFAVVAGEIRSLANRSGESASKIDEIMGTMINKIMNIQNQEGQVSRRLKEIISENSQIAKDINDIFKGLQSQIDCNTRIEKTVKELIDTVQKISMQTKKQKTSGEVLKNSLELLTTITETILQASAEQKSCNEELKVNLNQLQKVSENNLEVITDLKTLTN